MSKMIPVIARVTFEAYIPDTDITVKIPEGTRGTIIQEVRGDIVLVQFDVGSLPPLLADRDGLLVKETIDIIVDQLAEIIKDDTMTALTKYKEVDMLMLRTMRHLANDENRQGVEKLIQLFGKVPRPYKPAE